MLYKNFSVLRKMLNDTHSFKGNLLLTHNYKTSRAAHEHLEKMMKRKYEKVMIIDYGLKILPDTDLKIANGKDFQWLI
jgi:hypothetical protein